MTQGVGLATWTWAVVGPPEARGTYRVERDVGEGLQGIGTKSLEVLD